MASSSTSKLKKRKKPTHTRSLSASEISKNVGNFEQWSTYQGLDQCSYSDIPEDLKIEVAEVFKVTGQFPAAWVDQDSETYKQLKQFASPEIVVFVQDAFDSCPDLFSDDVNSQAGAELFSEITTVFSAWRRLRSMRLSKEKWSEAEFAANVYNIIRSPAIRESTYRVHCTVSLPQPSANVSRTSDAIRVLNTKTAIPDCSVFIPAANIRTLSHAAQSPFKVLKGHPTIISAGSTSAGSSFRYQATPCATLPTNPGFEFASCFFEDKKPLHQMLEDAYRQNRMATASAARHLHSMCVNAPIFGLVWSNGTVRAHVDWCRQSEAYSYPTVFSAPYPGSKEDVVDDSFHEWLLDRPSDILQVYMLIRNIDKWTVGKFHGRVVKGVSDLQDNVVRKKQKFHPWRRVGDLSSILTENRKGNHANTSLTVTTSSAATTPPRAPVKKRKAR